MGADRIEPDRVHIINGRTQPHRLDNRRRSRLETKRRLRPGGFLIGHGRDHVAAAHEGRHRVEQFALAVEHADPRWPVELVPGEDIEISVDGFDIDAPMHHRLRAIEQNLRAALMGKGGKPLGRGIAAEDVGHMGDGEQPHLAIGELPLQAGEIDLARIGDLRDPQLDAGRIPQHLPRHQIGVMFHLGNHDRLAGLQERFRVAMGDEVDGLGRVADEDDLLALGVQEGRRLVARGLIIIGGALAHPVQAAMHIGVAMLHRPHHRLDHGARLLRRGGAVEEH